MTEEVQHLPHAMVVGASSGIGFALAERLAKGHRVSALARRIDKMAPLAKIGVAGLACDVTNLDEIKSIVEAAVAERGKIQKLVYCAGLQSIKPLRGQKPADICQVISVNLTGAIVFANLFASQRISEPEAVFCGVSSIAAQRPEPGIISYAAAKAGMEALIKGMARECAPKRAIGVAPGWLDTEMTQSYAQIYNQAFKDRLAAETPRGIATTEAVVDMMLFLMSDQCQHITGQIITIDGGASL